MCKTQEAIFMTHSQTSYATNVGTLLCNKFIILFHYYYIRLSSSKYFPRKWKNQGLTERSLFRGTFRRMFRYFWWVLCSVNQWGNRGRWKRTSFLAFFNIFLIFFQFYTFFSDFIFTQAKNLIFKEIKKKIIKKYKCWSQSIDLCR